MVAEHRPAALRAIGLDTGAVEPFVLTCRSEEFESANTPGAVRDAFVVQLLPVAAETAANYLLDVAPDGSLDRWEPLLARLTDERDAPIAEALRTPLMLFLARTAYADPTTGPTELLAFPDARQVEEHLLDLFIRRVFTERPPSPLPNPARPRRRWDPEQAERWLTFLARHCGRDITWWQLYRLVPKPAWIG